MEAPGQLSYLSGPVYNIGPTSFHKTITIKQFIHFNYRKDLI